MTAEELLRKALELLLDIQWGMSGQDPNHNDTAQMIDEIQDFFGYE